MPIKGDNFFSGSYTDDVQNSKNFWIPYQSDFNLMDVILSMSSVILQCNNTYYGEDSI